MLISITKIIYITSIFDAQMKQILRYEISLIDISVDFGPESHIKIIHMTTISAPQMKQILMCKIWLVDAIVDTGLELHFC